MCGHAFCLTNRAPPTLLCVCVREHVLGSTFQMLGGHYKTWLPVRLNNWMKKKVFNVKHITAMQNHETWCAVSKGEFRDVYAVKSIQYH